MSSYEPNRYLKPPQTPFEKSNGWVTTSEKILVACMVILVFGGVALASWGSVRLAQTSDRMLENRAVSCRVLLSLGEDLDPEGPCYDPEVRRYYDPTTAKEGHQAYIDRQIACLIARQVNVPESELESICERPSEP